MLDRESSECPERSVLIATELFRFEIDIAALSETRLAEQGSLDESIEMIDIDSIGNDGYRFYWSRKLKDQSQVSGVCFAIRKKIVSKLRSSHCPQ